MSGRAAAQAPAPGGFMFRLDLPPGSERRPICGVVALAIATGRPFDEIRARIKKDKPARWRGITHYADYWRTLQHYGIKYTTSYHKGGRTLKDWCALVADPGKLYLVRTRGHMQVVCGGMVTDQRGTVTPGQHWGSDKVVQLVIEIHSRRKRT
jgi:hypothetical protein